MDHVQYPYRSDSHLALMHVIAESGMWEKHGLDVDYQWEINREDAHSRVPTGEVEFVSGNHVSTYAARARGDNWVYLGQTVSMNNVKLITKHDVGIDSWADLKNKRFGTRGRHPGLNDWLNLKQHGLDVDKDEIEVIRPGNSQDPDIMTAENLSLMDMIQTDQVDACFLSQPRLEFAERAGLKVIDIAPQPMVFFMTVSSSLPFTQKHPDIVNRMLKAVLEGIAFFKHNPDKAIEIILKKHNSEGTLDLDAATKLYNDLAPTLEPKLYPSMQAISNVYEEALRQGGEDAKKINPLELWDFHFLREIDDTSFIDDLYKDQK